MEHPFINNLGDKSIEELHTVIDGLTKKLTFAYRTNNGPLIHQLTMALESYKNQQRKKMDALFEKQKLNNKINIQTDNDHKN